MNLYVGNLPFTCDDAEVQTLFEKFGAVYSVNLIVDRNTGKKKGFGFVEMDDEPAEIAIKELNDTEFGGRNIKVNYARKR